MTLTDKEDTIGGLCFFAGMILSTGLMMVVVSDKSITINIINICFGIGLIGFLYMYLKLKKIAVKG